MKTIVLDDDPTGTQSATGVTVLFQADAELLTRSLRHADSVYVQTNSRALHEADAVRLVSSIKAAGEAASRSLGEQIQFVLRGDSTLRGHVFAESEVFLDDDAVMLFVPAFPDGGRTTRDGVHYVRAAGRDVPAHESEYAQDPVFPFSTGVLRDYVTEKSGRTGIPVPLDQVRSGGLTEILVEAAAGAVVLPDAIDGDDIVAIARAVNEASAHGRSIVVRCASPLAAELAGVSSSGLLPAPLRNGPGRVLLVCGSHTHGASDQLEPISRAWGPPATVDTAIALERPTEAGLHAADTARRTFDGGSLIILATQRQRSAEHNTLVHGERVMAALTTAVAALLSEVEVVVAKGGITSAEVASTGIGATSAYVVGQVLPGVSVWRMAARDGRELLYVVVPGNVGEADTLVRVLDALNVKELHA